MRENKTCPNQGWQQLPTEELDRILQAELAKEHPDEEVVLPILRTLEEREKDLPVVKTPEVLAIANKLSEHKTPSKRSIQKRRWLAGIGAAAAVACIVLMSIRPAVGAESLLDKLFRWTSSIFEFFTPEQDASNPPVDVIFETDNPGLQELYDKVTELGVTELVVPMWLPEGFTLSQFKGFPMGEGYKISCSFLKGNNKLSITYRISAKITTRLEKEDAAFEVFEAENVSHLILENDGNISVTWIVDGVECLLSANIPKEEIYTVIKSIYRSNLE